MASKFAIEAARAFVEFSADLSSLPGDFQDAESQFKAFKDRVNKQDALSSVRADLDTKAAEGKLNRLQSQVRDALDPKGAPLLANAAKELDSRLSLIEPRIRKLFELPLAKEAEIKKRADEQIANLANAEISSLKAANDRVIAAEKKLVDARAVPGKDGKAAVRAAQDELKEQRTLLKARETANRQREQSIREAAAREIDAYNLRREAILGAYQDEYRDLVTQRNLIEKELKKLGKTRDAQSKKTPTGIDEAIKRQEEDGKRFAAGLKARLTEEAKADAAIAKARDSQAKKLPTGFDVAIKQREDEGRAFTASLKARLNEEQKALDSAANAAEKAEDRRQRRLRRIRNARRRRDLREQKSLPTDLAVFGQDLRQVGAGLFGAGATGLVGFGLAAKEFAELDRILRSIKGTTSASEQQISSLEVTLRRLGATTSFTTREVANAALELSRGGQSIADIQNTLPAVLDLARGTGSDLAFSAQSVVRTLGQFQLATKDSQRVVDALAASANAGTLDLMDLGEGMKFLGSIAETTGESVESVGAAFAVMANNGLRGGLAGRQLRRVLYEMVDPLKRLKILQETGVDTFDGAGNLRPIADLVEEIGKAIDTLPSGKKVAFLDNVFGEGAAAFEALSKGRDEFRGLIAEVQAAEGYARNLAREVDGGLAGAFLIALSAATDLGIEIGKALGPMLVEIAKWFQDAAIAVKNWTADNHQLVRVLAMMTAAVTGVGAALLGLGVAVGSIAAVAGAIAFLRSELVATQLAVLVLSGPKGIAYAIAALASLAGLSYAAAAAIENQVAAQAAMGANALDTTNKVERLTHALQELAASGDFNAGKGLEKFRNLVKALEADLGPLGAKFDEATGKPVNVPEVTERAGLLRNVESQKGAIEALEQKKIEAEKQLQAAKDYIYDLKANVDDFGFGINSIVGTIQGQNAFASAKEALKGVNDELLLARNRLAEAEARLNDLPSVEVEIGIKTKGQGAFAESILAAGAAAAGRFGPMLATAFNSATGNATQDIQKNGFGASPLSSIGAFLSESVDDFRDNNLKGAFDALASAVSVGTDQVTGGFNWFAGAVRSTVNDNLRKRAEAITSQIDLNGLRTREGSFGLFEAQRQVAGQTTNLLDRVLRVEEQQKTVLDKIEQHLRGKAGLIGK